MRMKSSDQDSLLIHLCYRTVLTLFCPACLASGKLAGRPLGRGPGRGLKEGGLLETGAVAGVCPLESDTGLGGATEVLSAGDEGALVGPPGLTARGLGPGRTWRKLFRERPRPMDTRLKSVRWKAGLGEYLGVHGV